MADVGVHSVDGEGTGAQGCVVSWVDEVGVVELRGGGASLLHWKRGKGECRREGEGRVVVVVGVGG